MSYLMKQHSQSVELHIQLNGSHRQVSQWNQSVAVRSAPLIQPRLRLCIRVLEPGRVPFATQVIELLSISEQRGEMMTSTVPMV